MEVDSNNETVLECDERRPEDVRTAAKIAGIPVSNRPVQLLHFSSNLITDEIKLLQLTSDITQRLKTGQRVVLKGNKTDEAVLCTSDSTYELKVCETSNSLLVCPGLLYPNDSDYKSVSGNDIMSDKEVVGCISNVLEVKRTRPKLARLRRLLSEGLYKGPLEERLAEQSSPDGAPNKYSLSDLVLLVQASESEIMAELKNQHACLINDCWRVFDRDYRDKLVQHVLTLLEEQDLSWRCVPLELCCDKLSELHPPFAIKHCLDWYGVVASGEGEGVTYELKEEEIGKFYAEILLRPAGRFNYDEFIECWQQAVPVGMNTDISLLKGLALTDMNAVPPVAWFFPVNDLPDEPSERFAKLFSVREKWTYQDLEPYIRGLVTTSTTLNSLLLKYTRVSTGANGVKLYNSKLTAL